MWESGVEVGFWEGRWSVWLGSWCYRECHCGRDTWGVLCVSYKWCLGLCMEFILGKWGRMDGGGRERERGLFVIWVTEKMAARVWVSDGNDGNKEMMDVEHESSEDFDAIGGT